MNSFRKTLLVLALLAFPALSKAAPTILSVSYHCADSAIHIGSAVDVSVTVATSVGPSFNLSVSGTAGAASLTLIGPGLQAITTAGTKVLVTEDGQRLWSAIIVLGATNSIVLNNSKLVSGPTVTSYTSLGLKIFKAYDGGTGSPLMTGGAGKYVSVDIGTLGTLTLSDAGLTGIWTGTYMVPDLGLVVTNARLFAYATQAGSAATNDGVQSIQTLTLDALRPSIGTIHVSASGALAPADVNTNGLIYVAHSTMGQPVATGNYFNNSSARIDFTVNKPGCIITMKATGLRGPLGSVPDLVLSPKNMGGALNGTSYWDAQDGGSPNKYVTDGTYMLELTVTDVNGISGTSTRSATVTVTSLMMEIRHLTVSPQGINSTPVFAQSTIARISYDIYLHNDEDAVASPGAANILGALKNLGWEGYFTGAGVNDPLDFRTKVFELNDLDILKPDGSVLYAFDKDGRQNSDDDFYYLFRDRQSQAPACAGCAPFSQHVPPCFNGQDYFGDPDTVSCTAGTQANAFWGDLLATNDWTNALDDAHNFVPINQLPDSGGTAILSSAGAPTWMQATMGMIWVGATPPVGSYRVRARATLTGEEVAEVVQTGSDWNMEGVCSNTLNAYCWTGWGNNLHFFPTARPDYASDNRGMGLFVEDTTQIFTVSLTSAPTTDNSPPGILTNNPSTGATVIPGIYGPGAPLTAQLQDPNSPISVDPTKTRMSLTVIQNGLTQSVSGLSSTDAGSPANLLNVFFEPFSPLSQGGVYTMTINTCDINGNCGTYTSSFTIVDTAAPLIAAVDIYTAGGQIQPLNLSQSSPDGPFDSLSQVKVTLVMQNTSTNTIDWDNSTVQLIQLPTNVPIALNRMNAAGVPSDSKLTYSLPSPFRGNGTFQVKVITVSKNTAGTRFTGPASGFVFPQFIVQPLASQYTVAQGTNVILGTNVPLTITTSTYPGGLPFGTTVLGTQNITTASLPSVPAGFTAIAKPVAYTRGNNMVLQTSSPITLQLYYDGSVDLPTSVSATALVAKGYAYSTNKWTDYTWLGTSVIGLPGLNHFDLDWPAGVAVPDILAIFYPTSVAVFASATPVVVPKSTRSFNPALSDPQHNTAKIYYSSGVQAVSLEARVYNVAGTLVRTLNPANLALADPNTTDYYFTWDGSNDGLGVVRNGIYLIRFEARLTDGTTRTETKMVALIK